MPTKKTPGTKKGLNLPEVLTGEERLSLLRQLQELGSSWSWSDACGRGSSARLRTGLPGEHKKSEYCQSLEGKKLYP